VVGVAAGVFCALAIGLKTRFGYDDSLDVVGVHLVGGVVGCLMIGLVATDAAPSGVNGLFLGGGTDLLVKQTVASVSVLVFSFVVTYLLAKAIDATLGFRIAPEHEAQGIDRHAHNETAYDLTALVSLAEPVESATR
jgi:Amt family ammonium transporter